MPLVDAIGEEEDIDGVPLDSITSTNQHSTINPVAAIVAGGGDGIDEDDIDGVPLPLDLSAPSAAAAMQSVEASEEYDEDLDGVPMD